jgi:hypothetical protein
MLLFSRRARVAPPIENPLVPVVRPFSPKGKQSLYAAVNSGALTRTSRVERECGGDLGVPNERDIAGRGVADIFEATPQLVSRFEAVWNQLVGSDEGCAMLLREAIITVGLFTEADRRCFPAGDGETRRRGGHWKGSRRYAPELSHELAERAWLTWPLWAAVTIPRSTRPKGHQDWC